MEKKIGNITIRIMDSESVDESRLRNIAKAYEVKKDDIMEFVYQSLQERYSEIKTDGLEDALGMPTIDIDTDQVLFYEQTIDTDHVFSFEFVGLFDKLAYFTING